MKTLKKASFIVMAVLIYVAALPLAYVISIMEVIEKSVDNLVRLLPKELNEILDDYCK